jgi:hypothetical protein
MGTDIHMGIEVKRDGEWEPSRIVKNRWYSPKYPEECPEMVPESPYDNRNYTVFSILADVRNGRGFAGCDTGDRFVPISKPKGFPEDMHHLTIHAANGDHTPSWLTLKELKDYDWNQETNLRGFVQEEQFKRMREEGQREPRTWCGGISGGKVISFSQEKYEKLEAQGRLPEGKSIYVQVQWGIVYKDTAADFLEQVMPRLEALAKKNDLDDDEVRIVFNFDS